MDFISYLKTLKPADWQKKVNKKWTVKDVVCHMIGWEKIDPQIIKKTWTTKKRPWFYETDDYEDFNRKSINHYKKYTPAELIHQWEKWRKKVRKEVDLIGENKLRARLDLFKWLFDRSSRSHYGFHYRQIKKTVGNK